MVGVTAIATMTARMATAASTNHAAWHFAELCRARVARWGTRVVLEEFFCNEPRTPASACVQNFIKVIFLVTLSGCFLLVGKGNKGDRRPTNFVEGYDGNWKVIEVRPGMEQNVLWQTTIDAVATQFDMESLDAQSGYLRTGWKTGYGFNSTDKSYESYRVRVTGKFEPGFTRLRIKAEAEWNSVRGFDKALTQEVYTDLQGRIGRVVR